MIPKIIVHSDNTKRLELILEELKLYDLHQTHPNMLWIDSEKLGIKEARKVSEHLSLKPYQGKGQAIIILYADNLTEEAQNSLLKTLEEPPHEAVIILGASSENNFLPTVLSRCQVISSQQSVASSQLEEKDKKVIEKLINSSIEERFKFIEKLEDKEDFLKDLIIYYRELTLKNPSTELIVFLEILLESEKQMQQNVNPRAILEYLMLKIPNV